MDKHKPDRHKNPNRIAYLKKWRESRKQNPTLAALDKSKRRNWVLQTKYGITQDDYNKLLSDQSGVCAICKRSPEGKLSLAVDHNHKTGQIRGLLCYRCNYVLGQWFDNAVRFQAAADYLQKSLTHLKNDENKVTHLTRPFDPPPNPHLSSPLSKG